MPSSNVATTVVSTSPYLHSDQYKLLIGMIVMGAMTNALVDIAGKRKEKRPVELIDSFINVFVSFFAGTLFALAAVHLEQAYPVILIVSSMGAFLGLQGLNIVTSAVLDMAVDAVSRNKTKK